MKLNITKSGGLVPIRENVVDVNLSEAPDDLKKRAKDLVGRLRAVRKVPSQASPDRCVYQVAFGKDAFQVEETALSDEVLDELDNLRS